MKGQCCGSVCRKPGRSACRRAGDVDPSSNLGEGRRGDLIPLSQPNPSTRAPDPTLSHSLGTLSYDSLLHLGSSTSSIGSSPSARNTHSHRHLKNAPWMDSWFEIPSSWHRCHCSHLAVWILPSPPHWPFNVGIPLRSRALPSLSTDFFHHVYANDSCT